MTASTATLLTHFEVALFCFKGKALLICIAQPNGLGLMESKGNRRAKGPAVCNRVIHRLTNGRAFSPCDLKRRSPSPLGWLGKLLDLRSEILKKRNFKLTRRVNESRSSLTSRDVPPILPILNAFRRSN